MSQQSPPQSGSPVEAGFSTRGFTYSNLADFETRGPCLLFRAERQRRRSQAPTGEPVLVKRVQNTQDMRARRRLLAEASVLLLLDHPAIPRVLEVAEHSTGPHLVLEYVEGMLLEWVLNKAAKRKQPLSEPFAAFVAAEVADALHHAHTRTDESGKPLQLVHRAISPRTLMLTGSGAVKLNDFGAVRSVAPGQQSTDGAVLKGEVDYAAPEVLRAGVPDGRADIFSLGLVLVELLTLRHPYDLPQVVKPPRLRGLFAQVLGRVCAERPSWAEPADLAARAALLKPAVLARILAPVSEPLRGIISRALRVSPDERYAAATEMRDALRALLRQQHPGYGPEAVVREVRQVAAMAAREHGVVDTSEHTLPAAFKRLPTSRQ